MPALEQVWKHSFMVNGKSKEICIQVGNICETTEHFDILTCSAFKNDYIPTPRSLIGSLYFQRGISVEKLSENPDMDFKSIGGWLSRPVDDKSFSRIACIELLNHADYWNSMNTESVLLKSAFSTFRFIIEQANIHRIKVESVALPVLGAGDQRIESYFIIPPLVEQCMNALKTIPSLKRITFFDRSKERTWSIIEQLNKVLVEKSSSQQPKVFISYNNKQASTAKELFDYILQQGISCWMAPVSIPTGSNYQNEIPRALTQISDLVLLLTPDAENSRWVRKEVGTAIGANKNILPVQLINFEICRDFKFLLEGEQIYLAYNRSAAEWMAHVTETILTF